MEQYMVRSLVDFIEVSGALRGIQNDCMYA